VRLILCELLSLSFRHTDRPKRDSKLNATLIKYRRFQGVVHAQAPLDID
jgi:hypothetical protein